MRGKEREGGRDKELGCGWMWLPVEGKEEEEEEVGWRKKRVNGALWCIVGRRLQLPCRCAAWLTQRLAGSQSQCREAVPLQFSVSERTEEGRGEGGREGGDTEM